MAETDYEEQWILLYHSYREAGIVHIHLRFKSTYSCLHCVYILTGIQLFWHLMIGSKLPPSKFDGSEKDRLFNLIVKTHKGR